MYGQDYLKVQPEAYGQDYLKIQVKASMLFCIQSNLLMGLLSQAYSTTNEHTRKCAGHLA